jgi:hypothetical protein
VARYGDHLAGNKVLVDAVVRSFAKKLAAMLLEVLKELATLH